MGGFKVRSAWVVAVMVSIMSLSQCPAVADARGGGVGDVWAADAGDLRADTGGWVSARNSAGTETLTTELSFPPCGVMVPAAKILKTYQRYRADVGGNFLRGGVSSLACGSSSWGYRHIMLRHFADWQNKAAVTQDDWRALLDMSTAASLFQPDFVSYRTENDTFCFSTLIVLKDNKTHQVVDQFYPHVVVGHKTENIITSYPDTKPC